MTHEWRVVSAEEMAAADKYAIEECGIDGATLMERAGRAALAHVRALRLASPNPDGPVVCLCGPGNNGGDGYVLARALQESGVPTTVLSFGTPNAGSDAQTMRQRWKADGGRLDEISAGPTEEIESASVIVDALFGTGLRRALDGAILQWVRAINQLDIPVVSLDIPSGVHGTDGPLGVADATVAADITVTFAALKWGLLRGPGRDSSGAIVAVDIGIPDASFQRSWWVTDPAFDPSIYTAVAPRPLHAHKGMLGSVFVVGGSDSMPGAPVLTALGALRAGAGKVFLAAPTDRVLGYMPPECMPAIVYATPNGAIDTSFADAILGMRTEIDCAVLGPGISTQQASVEQAVRIAHQLPIPLVVDADGLNAIAASDYDASWPAPRIFTPHLGEARRLATRASIDPTLPPHQLAQELSARWNATILLKGQGSLVCSPEQDRVRLGTVVATGGPELACPGSGDVLAGIIAAIWARGEEPHVAAHVGATIHGVAGARIADRRSDTGVLASEIAHEVPGAMADLAEGTSTANFSSAP